jgi:putative sigma-54 modulation protein
MQISVTFRHMGATDALKEYARDRMERIKKYFPDPIHCHVVLTSERHVHRADVNVQLHNGFRIAGHESTENMYSSIDLVSAKIERQARRYKEKLRGHKVREMDSLPVIHYVIEDEALDGAGTGTGAAETAPAAQVPEAKPTVVSREQVDARPMTVSEAIMQLNLLHADFHVFRNEETGQISVVYRRADGAFGLIETAPAS